MVCVAYSTKYECDFSMVQPSIRDTKNFLQDIFYLLLASFRPRYLDIGKCCYSATDRLS